MGSIDSLLIVYSVVIALTTLILTRGLRALSQRRRNWLRENQDFNPLADEIPLDRDPEEVSRKRAMASVQAHFVNTRRLLWPTCVALITALAAIPLLTRVPAALLTLMVGVFTVIVGMAAKPMVENFVAGLVIGFSRVLNIGDVVMVSDCYATVEDISMTHTTLKLWDWRRRVVPNCRMLESEFLNYSLTDKFQWAYVEFWVSYESDMELVKELATAAPYESQYFVEYDKPQMWVMETAKEGIRCWVAAWADDPNDAWMLKADIRGYLMTNFQKHGITVHRHYHGVTDIPGAASAPAPSPVAAKVKPSAFGWARRTQSPAV